MVNNSKDCAETNVLPSKSVLEGYREAYLKQLFTLDGCREVYLKQLFDLIFPPKDYSNLNDASAIPVQFEDFVGLDLKKYKELLEEFSKDLERRPETRYENCKELFDLLQQDPAQNEKPTINDA